MQSLRAWGAHWSKQRLCERFGEFVPGPEIAEVAPWATERLRGTSRSGAHGTMGYGASIRMPLVPHGLGVRSSARRCPRRSMRPERRIGGISSCGITRLPPCPFLGRTNANSTSCSRSRGRLRSESLGSKIKGWRTRQVSKRGPGPGRSSWAHGPPEETRGLCGGSLGSREDRRSRATTTTFAPSPLAARERVGAASFTTCLVVYGSVSRRDRSSSLASPAMKRSSSS